MFPPDTRVLIVDDMATMRKLVKKQLTDLGFTKVTEADDGDTAWTKIEQAIEINAPFQLILSDWNMPRTKGIQLLKRVRSNSKMKDVPFIMLTAENEKDNVTEAIAARVSSYMIKPFTTEVFAEKLKAVYAATHKAPVKAAS